MTALTEVFVPVRPDLDRFEPEVKKRLHRIDGNRLGGSIGKNIGSGMRLGLSGSLRNIGGLMAGAFAAVKVGGFLKGAIAGASDLGETMSKSAAVFGPANKIITDFAATSAESFGQAKQEATAAAAQFGNMFNQLGIGQKPAANMSVQMTKLASDFASFHNADITQVLEAQQAAFRGEYDSIQKFVPTLNAAAVEEEGMRLKLAATKKELTAQDKAIAVHSLMVSGAGKAQGDFAKTSGGLANQQRILSARFADFKTSIGAVALPIATKFFGFLNKAAIPAVTGLFNLIVKGDFTSAMRQAFRVEEDSGFVSFLLKARDTAATVFTEIRGGITAFAAAWRANDGDITSSGLPGFMERVGYVARQTFGFFVTVVLPALSGLAGWIRKNTDFFVPFAAALGTIIVAIKAWAIAQGILNVVLAANPIGLVVIGLAALAAGLIWAYKNSETFRKIVSSAFTVVKTTGSIMWTILKPIFWLLGEAFKVVWERAQLFWRITSAAFNAIREPAKTALKFVLDAFLGFVEMILTGAAKAFGWVPELGGKLKKAAGDFSRFRDDVNAKLAGIQDQSITVKPVFDKATMSLASAGRRAMGGPGGPVYGPGTSTSDQAGLYALSNKEWVIRAAASMKYGDRAMKSVNAGTATIIPGFATGGRPGLSVRPGLPGGFEQSTFAAGIGAEAKRIGQSFAGALAKMLGVSPGLASTLEWVRSQVGKPYVWGAVGPGGYDCSGLVSAAINRAQGRSPHSRLGATGSMPWSMFAPGSGPFMVGWFKGNPGHTAATINGVNIESRGGRGVVMGSAARGASDSLFTNRMRVKGFAAGGKVGDQPYDVLDPNGKAFVGKELLRQLGIQTFDSGGWLQPGLTLAHNGTGKPERVGGGVEVKFVNCTFAGTSKAQFTDLVVGAVDDAKRKRRL